MGRGQIIVMGTSGSDKQVTMLAGLVAEAGLHWLCTVCLRTKASIYLINTHYVSPPPFTIHLKICMSAMKLKE